MHDREKDETDTICFLPGQPGGAAGLTDGKARAALRIII